MLGLKDFYHLPEMAEALKEFLGIQPGLRIVAGPNPYTTTAPRTNTHQIIPSGRAMIFHVLIDEMLAAHPARRCLIVTRDRSHFHIDRQFRRRVDFSMVEEPLSYTQRIQEAINLKPGLLVVDCIDAQNSTAIFAAAARGLWILTQFDTIFCGAAAVRNLLDYGVQREELRHLAWVLCVQRLPVLCPHCKQSGQPDSEKMQRLAARLPVLGQVSSFNRTLELIRRGGVSIIDFYQANGCEHCKYTGRLGDIAVFDVLRWEPLHLDDFHQPSDLPIDRYIWELVVRGALTFEDLENYQENQFRSVYNLLVEHAAHLSKTETAYSRKVAELEASNRVLQQRTKALFGFHDIGQALISSQDLTELAERVCRHTCELCGADRAVLYFQQPDGQMEILAVGGWDAHLVHKRFARQEVLIVQSIEPRGFDRPPPGCIPAANSPKLLCGIYAPLVAQGETVGVMVVHSTQKSAFAPGEMAMLRTFANQAALAMQRAGLEQQLRAKIDQLEAAQLDLAKKERMERELELARQVQESVLPRQFPPLPGYHFAAHNQAARQVGGDFYDMILLDENHFGVAIGDVSDKGLAAALFMALVRSLLHAEARRSLSPGEVVRQVNRLLFELGQPNKFVTLFYGVVEISSRRLSFCRSGHDYPILLRGGEALRLSGDGYPLGVFEENEFQVWEQSMDLSAGDRLVLYSDGLTDVFNAQGEMFGSERLMNLLQANASQPPEQLCQRIFEALAQFQDNQEQYDDMCLLIVAME